MKQKQRQAGDWWPCRAGRTAGWEAGDWRGRVAGANLQCRGDKGREDGPSSPTLKSNNRAAYRAELYWLVTQLVNRFELEFEFCSSLLSSRLTQISLKAGREEGDSLDLSSNPWKTASRTYFLFSLFILFTKYCFILSYCPNH